MCDKNENVDYDSGTEGDYEIPEISEEDIGYEEKILPDDDENYK